MSAASLRLIYVSNRELFSRLDEISVVYENDRKLAAQKVRDLEEYWGKYYIRISFVAQSSTLDDISYSVAKLAPLLEKDSDEFIPECRSIRHWAYLVYVSQFPHLYSVF